MKLIIAIVQDEDAPRLVSGLTAEGFSATRLATTGGFLRAGNTTLLIGVEEDKLQEALGVIERVCKSRTRMTASSTPLNGDAGAIGTVPFEVTIGGATVFVLSVDQFIKL